MVYRHDAQHKGGFIYVMMNPYRTVLYVGTTADLRARVLRHQNGTGSVFTAKYNCSDLVYFEEFPTMLQAIARETQLKGWKREWKLELIRKVNPELKSLDLYE